ncbi:hypothetical protein G7085_10865 [Tessaracoccus sp. HDW20]|uniref:hypothetical protein n=1 Tax=Tessaracoccus coleopterorum TaxID=2714950 RepID=UPI0018D30247|nr:hypothetical protein [Tessaracoccus coleopterorum]NHB84939.1 hypothetical protein [Tessaracoccus coleopterorum]
MASLHVEPKPPIPDRVKYGGLAALAALIIGAILLGVGLGGGFSGSPSASQSPTPRSRWSRRSSSVPTSGAP